MLITPLGPIRLDEDGEEIRFTATELPPDDRCRDVNGRYLIEYKYREDSRVRNIRCSLPSAAVAGEAESGERLEAISFYGGLVKLTIGIEASFGIESEYRYDYSGRYLSNGIEYETAALTKDQVLRFGISWISPYSGENEIQTWLAADPATMK